MGSHFRILAKKKGKKVPNRLSMDGPREGKGYGVGISTNNAGTKKRRRGEKIYKRGQHGAEPNLGAKRLDGNRKRGGANSSIEGSRIGQALKE